MCIAMRIAKRGEAATQAERDRCADAGGSCYV
eukprot:COSAG06_NODE_1377_length_9648_cov_2.243062_5_plen_32_part_00